MSKVAWFVIVAAILAACMADNDTIQAIRQLTTADLMRMHKIEFISPLPTPTYAIPRPTLER